MGAKQGASSSKGGMSNKSAESNAVVQGINADKYAQKKLGITGPNVMNTPAGTLVTKGFTSSTVPNQMYGAEYQAARNEYLANQGLGTVRADGSFMTGVQTDKGLVFTSQANEAFKASKRESIPLSKQMFESQKRFKAGMAAVAALAGIPVMPSVLYMKSRTPYQDYINKNKQMFSYRNIDSGNNQNKNQEVQGQEMAAPVGDNIVSKETKKKKYLASLKDGDLSKGDRKFITGTRQGFGGEYTV